MAPIFAFDFSMIKPAMTAFVNGKISFYVWTAHIDDKSKAMLEAQGVNVINRNLPVIKHGTLNENTLILEHIRRSRALAKMICDTVKDILASEAPDVDHKDVLIANEAFAFSAKGDAMLDLSGYKYILMNELFDAGFEKFRTFSPITIKKTGGCSKKGLGKTAMIDALANEAPGTHPFLDTIRENPALLKKKTAYLMCTDDIADSYWCYKTCFEKEINGE